MKKILIAGLLAMTLSGVFAQKRGFSGAVLRPRATVIINSGFYSPYYSFWYSPFGWGYPYPYVQPRPSKLDQTVADIQHDYDQRISSARSSLSGKEKRVEVRKLKENRDAAIDLAKRNYYRHSSKTGNDANGNT